MMAGFLTLLAENSSHLKLIKILYVAGLNFLKSIINTIDLK